MHLPGLLIEYLITGGILLGFLLYRFDNPFYFDGSFMILFYSMISYVLGMIIDVAAFKCSKSIKQKARDNYKATLADEVKQQVEDISTTERHVKIHTVYPDIKKEIDMRNSRDRVARGLMIISFLSIWIFIPYPVLMILSAGAVILFGYLYYIAESLTFRYEVISYNEILKSVEN
jgi:hypothetical protein